MGKSKPVSDVAVLLQSDVAYSVGAQVVLSLLLLWYWSVFIPRLLHTTPVMSKIVAGKYKVTLDKSKPLTYEMAVQPDHIGIHKSFNSFNTGQLEDTLGYKKWHEKGGTLLSHKLFMEDLFIRKYNSVTFSILKLLS